MWVGVAPPEAEVAVKPYDVFRKELTIRGSYTNSYVMERALALLASERIDWRNVVTHRFPLNEFGEAWEAHRSGAGLKYPSIRALHKPIRWDSYRLILSKQR